MTSITNYSDLLTGLLGGVSMSFEDTRQLFLNLLSGQLSPAQIGALLIALRCKQESTVEISAAATAMKELVLPVEVPNASMLVDLCGTGGDGAKTFNISTAAMFVVAACDVPVAKHGGRSVSSSSGSADVLEALGANIQLNPGQVASCIKQIGIGFMFAPNHHSAMKYAAPVRKQLGVRTIFNLLGPLTNPANAKRQLMGVYDRSLLSLQANVLKQLGSAHALIVHGESGLDELSIDGPTFVAELKNNEIQEYVFTPEQAGIKRGSHQNILVNSVQESLSKFRMALNGQGDEIADIVALNSGAAMYVGGSVDSIKEGVARARQVMLDGTARKKLQDFVNLTQQLASGAGQ